MEEQIKKITEDLLEKLGVEPTVEVTEEEGSYRVSINTEENALLIGKHGNTLSSIEHVLSLMVAKETGEFKRILIEIGDYRKERESYLKNLAERLSSEVKQGAYEKRVSGLKPWERRLIHMFLSEDGDITTESTGEDRDRVLIIKKK